MKTAKYILEEFLLPILWGILASVAIYAIFKILYKLLDIWRS